MAKKATTPRTNNTTAAPADINKADAIRKYHAENPEAGPSAIAEALNAQGITVTASRVSTVLRGGKKSRKGGLDVDRLKIAADFAKSYEGSAEEAKAAIEKLAKFIDECGGASNALEALDAYQAVADAIG